MSEIIINTVHDTPRLSEFRDRLTEIHTSIRERFDKGAPASELVHVHAKEIDKLLCRTWSQFFGQHCDDISLIAVGGYGRGELLPCSDIDIMILLRDDYHEQYNQAITDFVTFCWDVGLEVGHSVRTVEICVAEAIKDITVITNIIESRLIIGAEKLYKQLRKAISPQHIWPSKDFFEAKLNEQRIRHHKYGDSAYNLEPNIKDGPGGLRDIHMILWAAKRHFDAENLHDLVKYEFLTQSEYNDLVTAQNFLWQVRFALHTLTGRREDRLLFDYQPDLAQKLGYKEGDHKRAVELFMMHYYRTIKELSRLNEMLLQHFSEAILYADQDHKITPLNRRFQERNSFLEVVNDKVFARYPSALLEIFLVLQQNPQLTGVRASTIRLIRQHCYLIDDDFRAELANRSLFMEIIRQPQGVSHELRRMHSYGVLAAYLPSFANLVGQMQFDLFHIYTVDEHILTVVRNIRRFFIKEYASELPLCSQIATSLPKPEILYLAGLFHDIGKGRGGDHSTLGEQDAIEFCLHHGMSNYDSELVAWLVKNHLLMSMTAQRKDISDPDTISEFARHVGDQTRLDYIYLLTVGDIRGTNPKLWNSWRASLLQELYALTRRALFRGLDNPLDRESLIAHAKRLAKALLEANNISAAQTEQQWSHLEDEYFLRNSAEEIAWQTEALINIDESDLPFVMVCKLGPHNDTKIFTYSDSRLSDPFAANTTALEKLGISIHDAAIYTTPDNHVINSYTVLGDGEHGNSILLDNNEITASLKRSLATPSVQLSAVTRQQQRRQRCFNVATKLSFSNDVQSGRTMMEVVSTDQPGILSRIAQILSQHNITVRVAKIATLGERVEDIFALVDHNNKPLTDETLLETLRREIMSALDAIRN